MHPRPCRREDPDFLGIRGYASGWRESNARPGRRACSIFNYIILRIYGIFQGEPLFGFLCVSINDIGLSALVGLEVAVSAD